MQNHKNQNVEAVCTTFTSPAVLLFNSRGNFDALPFQSFAIHSFDRDLIKVLGKRFSIPEILSC